MGFLEDNWSGLVGVAGVGVSLLGFVIAIAQIRRTRTAAQAAEGAARETRGALARNLTLGDLSGAREQIQRLKETHRAGDWQRALFTYPLLRRALADIKTRHGNLQAQHRVVIQTGIQELETMETEVEQYLSNPTAIDVIRFNKSLTGVQTLLDGLMGELVQVL
jgi:hypothetical protein